MPSYSSSFSSVYDIKPVKCCFSWPFGLKHTIICSLIIALIYLPIISILSQWMTKDKTVYLIVHIGPDPNSGTNLLHSHRGYVILSKFKCDLTFICCQLWAASFQRQVSISQSFASLKARHPAPLWTCLWFDWKCFLVISLHSTSCPLTKRKRFFIVAFPRLFQWGWRMCVCLPSETALVPV